MSMRDPETVLAGHALRNEEIDDLRRIAGRRCARIQLLHMGIIEIAAGILSFAVTIPLSTLLPATGLALPLLSCLVLVQSVWNLLVPRLLSRVAEALVALSFLTTTGVLVGVCLLGTRTLGPESLPVSLVSIYLGAGLASTAAGRLFLGRRWGFGAEATRAELSWLHDLVRRIDQADDRCTDIMVFKGRAPCFRWKALHMGEMVVCVGGNPIFRGLAVLVAPLSEVDFTEDGVSLSGQDVVRLRIGRHRLKCYMEPNTMRKYQVWKHRTGLEEEAAAPALRAERPALANAYFASERHPWVQGQPRPRR
jgi:hypothetical protein